MTREPSAGELVGYLYSVLTQPLLSALHTAVYTAEEGGWSLYLVGGAVRDLMLGRPLLDLDLVVEGNAIPLAEAVAGALGAALTTHATFSTASILCGDRMLDLASARSETYTRPGALPAVRPASLEADLARRDFTINAIALRLTPKPPALLDSFAGRSDLATGLVRVLHDASFQDDATRLLRAARYAARLGFRIEPQTASLMQRDRHYLDTVSGARILDELLRTLAESTLVRALRLAQEFALLRAIHPTLDADEGTVDAVEAALDRGGEAAARPTLFCLIADGVRTPPDVSSLSGRLALPGALARPVADLPVVYRVLPQIRHNRVAPSRVVELLEPLSLHALWAVALRAGDGVAREQLRRYLETWCSVRPELRGEDILALGVPPGPAVGQALRRLRAARLDGLARSREDEIALVRSEL